ncbi:DNA polymerase-3 subunit delta [Sphingomonas jejuensis]|uniref:DNA-directed DNA polymerase n=1 Tax=Sphingomonas jejuensis TaxID=904715 RepID=A0ABX0XNU5_9SPHN|nr:DNA polymerase III subunit delta [Sphingomonas jejuensis]NJC34945.1 DNA polymerase-3 subunit delta [Sphingomonas jejuensis]
MKADTRSIGRALDAPSPEVRLYLLHGPDEGGSRSLSDRFAKAMGADAERVDLDGPSVAKDPARLVDEAASSSLFGERRFIRLRVNGDEAIVAVQALLAAEQAGHPVVVIAPQLKSSSALLKAVLAAPNALAFGSYALEGADAGRVVVDMGRDVGVRLTSELAIRIAEDCAGDRARIASELEKLMLYADAAPDRPREVDNTAVEQLGSGVVEDAPSQLVNDAFSGDPSALASGLSSLQQAERTPLLRAAQRRAVMLMEMRARIEGGESPDLVLGAATRTMFWKDKGPVSAQARLWTAAGLEEVVAALIDAELDLRGGGSGDEALDATLLNTGRRAARRR